MDKAYYIGQVKDEVNNTIIKIISAIAEYDNIEKPRNRFYLEIILNKNDKKRTLTTIMFNPSEKSVKQRSAFENKPVDLTQAGIKKRFIDGTITNVIRIANHCNYSKIVVLNLFSEINSTPKEIFKNPEKFINSENDFKIKEVLQQNDNDILVAWGSRFQNKIETNKRPWFCLLENKAKCFSMNKISKTPTHPSPRNQAKVNEFLNNKNSKLEPIV